ncbi:MAG: glycosyltransferase, partial [Chloroflexota bacterium]
QGVGVSSYQLSGNGGRAIKRVVHVYQDFYPQRGGIEDHILTLAQNSKGAYEHVVLAAAATPFTRRETVGKVMVIRAAAWGRYYTPFCPTMLYWLKRLAPSVIHLHHPCPMAFVAGLAPGSAPIVVGYHNDIVKPRALFWLFAPLQRAILQRAQAILLGTQDYLQTSDWLKSYRRKCIVIPYGIQLERFSPTEQTQTLARRIRREFEGPLVLFVGRLCYYKGLEVAIPAMKQVNATLLLVGSGPLAGRLRQLVQAYDLERKVKFIGPVDDRTLTAYYQASDLLILPSTYRSEAFGLVMLQAQACGLPVICSDLPGLSTVNTGQTGRLVPPGQPAALAQAINDLLARPALRQQLGQAGQEQVQKFYRADLMSRRIEQVYNDLTPRPPHHQCPDL